MLTVKEFVDAQNIGKAIKLSSHPTDVAVQNLKGARAGLLATGMGEELAGVLYRAICTLKANRALIDALIEAAGHE